MTGYSFFMLPRFYFHIRKGHLMLFVYFFCLFDIYLRDQLGRMHAFTQESSNQNKSRGKCLFYLYFLPHMRERKWRKKCFLLSGCTLVVLLSHNSSFLPTTLIFMHSGQTNRALNGCNSEDYKGMVTRQLLKCNVIVELIRSSLDYCRSIYRPMFFYEWSVHSCRLTQDLTRDLLLHLSNLLSLLD